MKSVSRFKKKRAVRVPPEREQSLEEVRRAAEGLEALQKETAAYCTGKPPICWKEFKSFAEEGRR